MLNCNIGYYYDVILWRNVYGVMPDSKDMDKLVKIAKLFSELSSEDSKKYIMVRLEMLGEVDGNWRNRDW